MISRPPSEWFLYLRKSVGYTGVERQRTTTTAYLEGMGGRVISTFSDADKTAYRDPLAPLPPRPDFDAMLAEMARHPDAGVGAWHADRLGRDPEAAEILIRACIRGGHLIATRSGGQYDVTTANGRAHLRGDINRATHEVDHNVERLIEAKAEKAAAGLWLGGPRPFGWRPAGDGRLELDADEAALIAQGSADVLTGVAVREITRRWNAAGITGTSGAQWTSPTVRKVLIRPRNAGLAEHHGQVTGPTTAWPAIVGEDTWRVVRGILTDPARRANHGGTAAAHLMSGIALCGGCGVAVAVVKSAEGTPRYRCSRHFRGLPAHPGPHVSRRVADVDAYIAALAVGRFKRDDAAALLRPDHSAGRAALLDKQAWLDGRQREQWQMYQDGVITAWEVADGRRSIDAERKKVRDALAALEEADVLAPMLYDPERVWDAATLDQQRRCC